MVLGHQNLKFGLRGTFKNSNFCVSARKCRPQSRSLRKVNEGLRAELTQQSDKKCIFRGALVLVAVLAVGWPVLGLAAQAVTPDVRLVIDVSGSMKRNDPNDLRQPAVELLMQLLPEGSKAGVWTFGKYVNMLVPHRVVDDKWRDMARSKAQDINSVGLFTNIGDALERAAHDAKSPKPDWNTSIILLTDGMVDIDKDPAKNKAEWRRIADEVLPKLHKAGFTVHTIALSDNADKDLMQKLALTTDGIAAVANNADDLMKIFLKAFDVAAPAQKLPMVDNAFVVDSSVEEFTALIFREVTGEDTQLLGPDESLYDQHSKSSDVAWHRTGKYDLITVKQPLEGEWKVKAAVAPDSRITVVSDLSLRVRTLPNNVFRGALETVNFALQEEGKVVTRPTFLQLLNNSISLGFGEGDMPTKQTWSHDFKPTIPPKDGVYRKGLPTFDALGTYDILIQVDGKTFKRQYTHRLIVREPFSAELKKTLDEQGQEQYVLTVRAHGQNVVVNKTQIAASVTNPKRRKTVKPLGLTDYDNWQTVLNMDLPGKYVAEVQVSGVDGSGEEFEYHLTPIEVNHQPDDIFNAANDEAAEPEVAPVLESASDPAELIDESPEPKAEAEVEPSEEAASANEEPEPQGTSLPNWVIYVALGLANLILLGGGFWLFKKLMSDPDEGDGDDDDAQEPLEEVESEAAPAPEPEVEAPEEPAEAMDMDLGASEDEIPPMEDIDGGTDNLFEEEEPEEPETTEPPPMEELDPVEAPAPAAEDAPPELDEVVEEDDFGVDDLDVDEEPVEDIPLEEPKAEPSDENPEDIAQEMLKAQGLDLPEDELDDAISSLIDELDGDSSDEAKEDTDDFDDFGLDDKK